MVGIILIIFLCTFGACVYLIPTMVANQRGHQNAKGIGLLNLLAGWTFIGWIAALVMACGEVKSQTIYRCPDCMAVLADEDRFCPRCGATLFG